MISAVFMRNIKLLESGIVKVTLRNGAENLQDLALKKGGKNLRLAKMFDDASSFIRFDEKIAASEYRSDVINFMESISRNTRYGHETAAVGRIMERVASGDFKATPDNFMNEVTNIEKIDRMLISAYRFFYCLRGAKNAGGGFEVPETVWSQFASSFSRGAQCKHITPSMMSYAHSTVFEHFSISSSQIFRLMDSDLIDLKEDGATKSAIIHLRKIVDDVCSGRDTPSGAEGDIDECRRLIRDRVSKRCLDEVKMANMAEKASVGADDILPALAEILLTSIPMWGTMKKVALRIGRLASRKYDIKRLDITPTPLDITPTPIATYISRLHGNVAGRPL